MNHLIGVLPVFGTGSLDGFAVGILVAGACFFALATPWRPHKRDAVVRYDIPPKPRPDPRTWRPTARAPEDLMSATKLYATKATPTPTAMEQNGLTGHRRSSGNAGSAQGQQSGLPRDLRWSGNAGSAPAQQSGLPGGHPSSGNPGSTRGRQNGLPSDRRSPANAQWAAGEQRGRPGDLGSRASTSSAEAERVAAGGAARSADSAGPSARSRIVIPGQVVPVDSSWFAAVERSMRSAESRLAESRPAAGSAPVKSARGQGDMNSRQDDASVLGERLVRPDDVSARPGNHRAAHPLGDPTFGSEASQQKPPGGRHAPRHAAPAPTLSGKVSGLFTSKSLADTSRG